MNKYTLLLIPIIFSLFDLLTGLFQALKNHVFSSTKMREGLWHKVGILCLLALSIGVEYAQTLIDLGINIPAFTCVAIFITLMEIGSIVENVCKINENLLPGKILALLGLNKNHKEDK